MWINRLRDQSLDEDSLTDQLSTILFNDTHSEDSDSNIVIITDKHEFR